MHLISTLSALWLLIVSAPLSTAQQHTSASNPSPQSLGSVWSGWGGNIYNNRWASTNSVLNSSNAVSFTQKCHFNYSLGVSATPTVHGDIVYYPTWSGQLIALNYKTCNVQWTVNVTNIIHEYAPVTDLQSKVLQVASRSSPQIDGNTLYFTTLVHALLVAVDLSTGAKLAAIQINPHPIAMLTQAPTVYNHRIFIGASSFEEVAIDVIPNYPCCSFVGNMAALDFDRNKTNFTVAWNVSMLPANKGWSGGAIWGSQPSIDLSRSQVFIGTGNLYTIPPAYQECQNQTANITVIASGEVPSTCIPSDVYQEAVLAFDIDTGTINWARVLSPLDAWQLACGTIGGSVPRNETLCPFTAGPDADFGMAPTFVPGSKHTPFGKDAVVVGQKNGVLHAISAQAGTPFWSTITSPDGSGGGISWGVAVDDSQVYFTADNSGLQKWTPKGTSKQIKNSGFGAASLTNGSLVWEVAAPGDSISVVPPSVVNDVVLVGYTNVNSNGSGPGAVLVLDKMDGKIMKQYPLEQQYHGGIAIQDSFVMFGTGYDHSAAYNGTGEFHVWSV